ncbi:ABC transporter substrate-binding protein [Pseudonocardia sp. ICBG1293]|uniref:ABC transporter substrate-binding protein n=1 Tax=Pseudonocardia sp. ICBG1293 TaxID=2844382 RepID=UPI001CCC0326|nr:ABC transporter substrate-binding protein [Pseudonocardia sp. ICBG1293]
MRSTRRVLPVLLTVLGVLAAAGCTGIGTPTAPPGVLNIGLVQDVATWDTGQGHNGHRLVAFQPAYDTLIRREPDGTFVPMLAVGWGYTDGTNTTFSLRIREGVTFSDGTPVDAAAVAANLEHFRTANGPQAVQLADVAEVRTRGTDRVEIELERPNPALEFYLSQAAGMMASPAALGDPALDRVPVGAGPYVMDAAASVPGDRYVFRARPDYWDPALQRFDQVVLKVLTDPTARINALVSGQIDATQISPRNIAQAENAGREIVSWDANWAGLLLFDRDGAIAPELADVRVRRAINLAFDREVTIEGVLNGYGTPTSQVFGEASTAFDPALDDHYGYDPVRARALLAEAGYPDGFSMTMPLSTGLNEFIPFIVQPLADIGITARIESVPAQSSQAAIGSGRYPASFFAIFQGPTWVAVEQLLVPQTLYNPLRSRDPALDAMLDRVRAGGPDADDVARQMARHVTEQAWFAPWARIGTTNAIDPERIAVEPQIGQVIPSIYNYRPVG